MSGAVSGGIDFAEYQRRIMDAIRGVFLTVGVRVADEAVRNAPVSPSQAELDREYERKRGKKALSKRRKSERFRRRKNRPLPGGLEKSIGMKVDDESICVFVPSSAAAGDYAHYIHDMKNVLWRKRGLGTRNKGPQADEKFIYRAIHDNEERITKALQTQMEKALRRIV